MAISREFAPRDYGHRSKYKYVRLVTNGRDKTYWQARGWLPLPIGSVNLGCYTNERAAWDAVKRWVRAGGSAVTGLPAKVLPKWVVERTDGRFDAEVRSEKKRSVLPGGPWDTAEAAHLAAFAEMQARRKSAADARRAKRARVLELVALGVIDLLAKLEVPDSELVSRLEGLAATKELPPAGEQDQTEAEPGCGTRVNSLA